MAGDEDGEGGRGGCPISRRQLLRGGVALGAAATLAGLGGCARGDGDSATRTAADDGTRQRQPFHGPHQAGIVTPTQAAALVAAFDVLGRDRERLRELLRRLTGRIAFLTQGGPVPALDPRLPPADSGLLGPQVFPDNLTVTVGVGASLFDDRFGLAALKPRHLVEMPAFPNDALDAARCDGDLLLQICSNTAETNLHALRDIVRHLSGFVGLRWTQGGFLPPHTVQKLGRDSIINLMGFKDGTANPDAADAGLMARLVWVQPGQGEPAWATGGSYQVVRIIRNFVEFWDRTPLREQERIIGRHKDSGAPLGMRREHDAPDYAADPDGAITPLDAHIRLANPRTPGTRRILRRAFNYANGATRSGQLDMGLLFVCYQSDLAQGFVAAQTRLNGEPLEEYVKPVGGGYWFALPGVPEADGYLGQGLFAG
ncbi:iron uptake transporter deferrochelatase/peroxidase subunit [Luteimonas huabeiensis]|uniref:iron uptake transporter deferrochelatase/peroxidase subunit n=1 Tax=Luteimonas huabeiensis TaxID=1244513 RepID=UPI000465910A|nr:iron uptake transporter deferrochelatase/peroxidase subunit [Luteimonas huabeiensis]